MTETEQPTQLGSGTVAALEAAWADIRSLNPDVAENVVFRIGSGSAGRRGGLVLGSITVDEIWVDNRKQSSRAKTDPAAYREVFIAGETLAQHPVALLQTLIHEAAHSVAFTRGVKDCSRQNRFHNGRFRKIAEEMGLEWAHTEVKRADDGKPITDESGEPVLVPARQDTIIGWSDMTITRQTAKSYKDTVINLDKNVSVQLAGAGTVRQAPPKKRHTVCFVATGDNEITTVDSIDDATEIMGHVITAEEAQRVGATVYDGLRVRNLLVGHVVWHEYI